MLVAALAVVPLCYVATYVVIIGPAEAWELIVRPRLGMLLGNTLRIAASSVVVCTVLGLALGWLVERTDLPGKRLWHGLLVAPLAVPAFVNSYAWVSLTHDVQNYAGATLIVSLSYYPLVYLPVVATLRGLDPALEETAASLGQTRRQIFRRVVLPQLRPAILGGGLLVALHLLAEYGALQMLRFPTFTTAIYDLYGSAFNGPAGNMIASVLVLVCLVFLVAELKLRGHRRYARIGHGAARRATPLRLGALRLPAVGVVLLVVILSVGVPTYALLHWLRIGTSTEFPVAMLAETTLTSLFFGVGGALVTTLMALPVAWLAVRHRSRASTLVERSTYVANALPGIVVALALVTVAIRAFPAIYQTTGLLLIGYGIMFLPRAVVSVRAALEQAPVVYDDVAHSLGTRPLATARRVTLPIIAPGVGAGAALVFLAVATELTATLMLAPIGARTLATEFWNNSSSVQYGAAAPYALLMVLISIPATILLLRQVGREERLRGGRSQQLTMPEERMSP